MRCRMVDICLSAMFGVPSAHAAAVSSEEIVQAQVAINAQLPAPAKAPRKGAIIRHIETVSLAVFREAVNVKNQYGRYTGF